VCDGFCGPYLAAESVQLLYERVSVVTPAGFRCFFLSAVKTMNFFTAFFLAVIVYEICKLPYECFDLPVVYTFVYLD
jgi:hypothetical protein